MSEPRIVERGDGPRIEGTRITVYTVLEYLRAGRTRECIATMLNLTPYQVQAAMDYIRENETKVNAVYEQILARIRQGNPPEVEERLRINREKVKARLARQHTTSK